MRGRRGRRFFIVPREGGHYGALPPRGMAMGGNYILPFKAMEPWEWESRLRRLLAKKGASLKNIKNIYKLNLNPSRARQLPPLLLPSPGATKPKGIPNAEPKAAPEGIAPSQLANQRRVRVGGVYNDKYSEALSEIYSNLKWMHPRWEVVNGELKPVVEPNTYWLDDLEKRYGLTDEEVAGLFARLGWAARLHGKTYNVKPLQTGRERAIGKRAEAYYDRLRKENIEIMKKTDNIDTVIDRSSTSIDLSTPADHERACAGVKGDAIVAYRNWVVECRNGKFRYAVRIG